VRKNYIDKLMACGVVPSVS